jgi:hypothetical protein
MSHHTVDWEAIRASSTVIREHTVIGENRHSSGTQFVGGQSIHKMKLNRLKMHQGTLRSPKDYWNCYCENSSSEVSPYTK